ncbi:ATP-binding protein [Paenibacillus sp. 32352]|uniref:ATP-binding protein n=1 Tax=Paenibacillus sp. 32352 TaxID=1969111 RepID=UPI0009AC2ED9|nr:ATP-binding protein [Paenibacillus sp. 32352]
MDNNALADEIALFISSKRESDYWDFKEKYHSNKANLLHDIICMANNRADRDAYIIFGVSDVCEIKGVEGDENRKTQQNVIDFLKAKKFSGGIRPSVELKSLFIQGKQIDVLIVKNSTDTPFFLTEDYSDQGRIVRANYIYTRVGDSNTEINKSADINHIEYLWKKRFLLNRPPLEQIKNKLRTKSEWKREEGMFYNVFNPEYTISLEYDEDCDQPEFYSYVMTNHSTSFGILDIRCFGTKMFSQQYAVLDSGRYLTTVPEWGFISFEKHNHSETYSYKYFVKDSLNYILHEFLLEDDHEAIWARNRFYEVVVTFNNEVERDLFEEYLVRNKQQFIDELCKEEDSYEWIYSENEREKQHIRSGIKTGIALNSLLEKYRRLKMEQSL